MIVSGVTSVLFMARNKAAVECESRTTSPGVFLFSISNVLTEHTKGRKSALLPANPDRT